MNILVWGLGYVGTVVSACFAELGHHVIGVETNPEKVNVFNSGRSPIKEPGLDKLIQQGLDAGRLRAVTSGTEYVAWADVSLICVGTPSAPDGSPVLNYIESVARDLGHGLRDSSHYHTVVLRSTVFPHVTRGQLLPWLEHHSQKTGGQEFGLAINPEFLRETTAIKDFYAPPYTVIGELDNRSGQVVANLYDGVNAPIYRIGIEEAELIKVVNNCFHALKIGFANEIGRLCGSLSLNANVIMDVVCADTKLNISPAYLRPGFAFGGSCLPKDLRSLTFHARCLGRTLPILESVLPSNELQVEAARLRIHEFNPRKVAILGLSFKSGTDDLRESPVISLIRQLWEDGVELAVFDPDVELGEMVGANRAYLERQLPQIAQILKTDLREALQGAQVAVLTKELNELQSRLVGDELPMINLAHIDETVPAPNAGDRGLGDF
ncbi:MAG: nucleotide sugar dehydrogenase [Leptolyngbyaceae cyanobacterium RU_5_1]|nr:nucleotide sugar dehydrogenase [Leptolyngbyaceae cyanobacterium RU_5_1]